VNARLCLGSSWSGNNLSGGEQQMLDGFFPARRAAKLHAIRCFEKRLDVACSLRLVGLACAILLAGVAAVAAQSETWSAPPIRLPGIAYPKPADTGVRATTPKLKPKAQSDRPPSAPETPGVAYPGASATIAVTPTLRPKDRSTQPLEVPAAREPPSSIPPEIPVAPQTSQGLLAAPGAKEGGTSAPHQREAPYREPTPEPQAAGNDGQQKSKTDTADTATHAISAPELSGSATLPNGKDTPVVRKIIELLQATGYSDYAPHEIPPEVIALEPALAMFRFVKRPDGRIGLVSGLSP